MNLTVASHKHLTKHSFYYEEGSLNLQKTYLSNTYLYVWQTGQPVPWQTGFQKSSLFPTSNRQKLNFKFHPCNNSAEICAYIHKHMSADSLYSSKPDFFKTVVSFKHTEEPFNDGSLFIDFLKRTAGTQGLQNILSFMVFFKIKGRTIFALPAFIFKEAFKGIFFIKTAAEFESLPCLLFSPIAEFNTGFADEFSLRSDCNISPMNRIFPSPRVCRNIRGDILSNEIRGIVSRIISCICNHHLNAFSCATEDIAGIFGECMQEFTIPFIACCYFDGGWDVLFCISDLKMNFIPEEGEILAFISLCCMAIGFESLKMRGVYGEFQVFNSDETKTLSNKISHVFTKDLQVFA